MISLLISLQVQLMSRKVIKLVLKAYVTKVMYGMKLVKQLQSQYLASFGTQSQQYLNVLSLTSGLQYVILLHQVSMLLKILVLKVLHFGVKLLTLKITQLLKLRLKKKNRNPTLFKPQKHLNQLYYQPRIQSQTLLEYQYNDYCNLICSKYEG